MKIAAGADHAGFALKHDLVLHLRAAGHTVVDCGTDSAESVDYPDFAAAVARSVVGGEAQLGLLVCGSGLGVAIAANKVRGARAVTCGEAYSARMAREHNDANILCLGARIIGPGVAEECIDTFVATAFEGGRHARRVEKIAALDV